jgi:hypothetical protein
MRVVNIAVLLLAMPTAAVAQQVGGYVTAGSGSIDYVVSRETIFQASGGILLRVANDRIRLGVQGDLLSADGYFSGRGGPIGEITLLARTSRLQPFGCVGYLMADGGGMWLAGGGVDVSLNERIGLRFAVQDAFRSSTIYGEANQPESYTLHEPSLQVGVVWR